MLGLKLNHVSKRGHKPTKYKTIIALRHNERNGVSNHQRLDFYPTVWSGVLGDPKH